MISPAKYCKGLLAKKWLFLQPMTCCKEKHFTLLKSWFYKETSHDQNNVHKRKNILKGTMIGRRDTSALVQAAHRQQNRVIIPII